MKQIDVLNLEWPSNERDVNASAPVVKELRERGYLCVTGDIFSYAYYFARYRPKVFFMTSYQGAHINHTVCKLAYSLSIKVVTLIAEGNTRETAIEEMTWGNNKEKTIYFEKMLLWSNRSETLMHQYFKQLKGKTSVVGGVGFDRYKRLPFLQQEKFLKGLSTKTVYRKVIGLAGWGFDRVHDTAFYRKNKKSIMANFREGQKELHREDFELLQQYIFEVIAQNPDVLFILRPHPGLTDYQYDEFKTAKTLPNVYYSEPRICPFSISDLISVSDLWGGYETTTCLEAWLLGKETFLINPSGGDFNRDVTADGSCIITDLGLFHRIVKSDESLKSIIPEYCDIVHSRKKIIEDVIGYDDGESYKRAANEIEPIIVGADYPDYSVAGFVSSIGFMLLFKGLLRNINWLNRIRGLREVDQRQIERTISKYINSDKSESSLNCTKAQ